MTTPPIYRRLVHTLVVVAVAASGACAPRPEMPVGCFTLAWSDTTGVATPPYWNPPRLALTGGPDSGRVAPGPGVQDTAFWYWHHDRIWTRTAPNSVHVVLQRTRGAVQLWLRLGPDSVHGRAMDAE